jgi:2-haloacid dehalogenase
MSGTTHPPRALLFDVFGTCVDWRSTVTNALWEASRATLNAVTSSIPSVARLKATDMTMDDWGIFAQQWRNSYKKFTRSLASDPTIPWKSVDEHHLEALKELLKSWDIEGLWTAEETRALSLIWHRLDPWQDSEDGIKALNSFYTTCTLSNGNRSLLNDLKFHAKLDFTHIFSAEDFGSYKPSPTVYWGAAEKLGLAPSDCAMVAAHLGDLMAAKACGFQTIYVERPREEDWPAEKVQKAKDEGTINIWVSDEEGGFVAVAEKLGIQFTRVRRLSNGNPL